MSRRENEGRMVLGRKLEKRKGFQTYTLDWEEHQVGSGHGGFLSVSLVVLHACFHLVMVCGVLHYDPCTFLYIFYTFKKV